MKKNSNANTFETVVRGALALLVISAAASAPAAFAKPRPRKPASPSAGVIAHVQLPEGAATRMLLVKRNRKQYLYIALASPAALSVVDVSKPSRARIIEGVAKPGGTPTGDFQLIGNTLALFAASQGATVMAEPSRGVPESVTILNVDDPSTPREVRSFSGVTNFLTDDTRDLIYITNGEGLWIVKTKEPANDESSDFHQGG